MLENKGYKLEIACHERKHEYDRYVLVYEDMKIECCYVDSRYVIESIIDSIKKLDRLKLLNESNNKTIDLVDKMIKKEGLVWVIFVDGEFHTACVENQLLKSDIVKHILEKTNITPVQIANAMFEEQFEIGPYVFRKIELEEWEEGMKND